MALTSAAAERGARWHILRDSCEEDSTTITLPAPKRSASPSDAGVSIMLEFDISWRLHPMAALDGLIDSRTLRGGAA